jgi:glycosyltransferase A (GT-A) superfamily protein (DUF2064 family)
LLIAAREPVPGGTKTRLGRTIGMERACTLYRAFLADLAARFTPPRRAATYRLGWAFTPASCDFAAVIAGLNGDTGSHELLFVPQHGADWGERQTNLLRWGAAHGFQHTVLIASDSPQLSRSVVDGAFAALADRDVALGRVHDGGYYLIGLRGFHDVLTGVPMSTASAAGAVAARSAQLGLRVAELPATFDVDVAEDLALLRATLAADGSVAPATAKAMAALGLTGHRRQVRSQWEPIFSGAAPSAADLQ